MSPDDLERRIGDLFAEVDPPEGMRRWDGDATPAPARSRRALRLAGRRWRSWSPLALAAAVAVLVGAGGLVFGGVRLAGGGQAGSGPGDGPSGRTGAALAYDPDQHAVILFGGTDASGAPLGDTWAWDGSRWQQLHPATSPPARGGAGLAWDPGAHRLVLAGGMGGTATGYAPTPGSCGAPSGGAGTLTCAQGGGSCTSSARGTVCSTVITRVPQTLRDTWTWDGSGWQQEHPAHAVDPFTSPSMTTRPGGGVVIAGMSLMQVAGSACPATADCPLGTGQPLVRVQAWDGHDWSDLPAIPALDAQLVTIHDQVTAVADVLTPCEPTAAGPGTAASAPACLGTGASAAGSGYAPKPASSMSGAVVPSAKPVPVAPLPSQAQKGCPVSAMPAPSPSPPPAPPSATHPGPGGIIDESVCAVLEPVVVGRTQVLVLHNGAWVTQQATLSGPYALVVLSSDGGALLGLDKAGRTWTGSLLKWQVSGAAPVAFVAGRPSLAQDPERHVVVMVGGFPAGIVPTWEWDGSAWHLRAGTVPAVATAPAAKPGGPYVTFVPMPPMTAPPRATPPPGPVAPPPSTTFLPGPSGAGMPAVCATSSAQPGTVVCQAGGSGGAAGGSAGTPVPTAGG